jgi:glucose 1-dehydrogenase
LEVYQKTALVTGGSSGIGQGIAIVLAEEGYDVAITYGKNPDGAEQTQKDIEALGRRCFVFQASLHQADVPERVVGQAIAALGHLDLLVNNAGRSTRESVLTCTADSLDSLFNLNYRAYILAAGAAARHMVLSGIRGNIIFITSSRGERAYPSDFLYGGIKAALKRSCESIAMDLSPHGIRVNCVAPGATIVREDGGRWQDYLGVRIPAGRLGTPRENGHVVAFLASEKASYITGITVRVDGGLILPGMPETDIDNAQKRGWGKPLVDDALIEQIKLRDSNHGGQGNV